MWVSAREPPPLRARWTWVPGSPGELHIGQLRFPLGDAGDVELPPVLRSSGQVFQASRTRAYLGEDGELSRSDRTHGTLVLQAESERVHGTLHVAVAQGCRNEDCSDAALRCDASVGISGRRLRTELVAIAR